MSAIILNSNNPTDTPGYPLPKPIDPWKDTGTIESTPWIPPLKDPHDCDKKGFSLNLMS